MNKKTLCIGHRGACGYAPENTLASFARALELGVDMVELDVHVCKTGELVVIHDETLERTTNGSGAVADKTFAELSRLDAGRGERIPLLSEVFDLVARRAGINIELKGAHTAAPAAALIKKYKQVSGWSDDEVLVSSLNPENLREFSRLMPQVKIGLVTLTPPSEADINSCGAPLYSIHQKHATITKQSLAEAKARHLAVFAWTVNAPADIQRLISLQIDGIFSDYPDRL